MTKMQHLRQLFFNLNEYWNYLKQSNYAVYLTYPA